MAYQSVFKRYELKYVLDPSQADAVRRAVSEHMTLDKYGHSVIRNIYFDTPDDLLVRRSNEKPFYKEKLRVRSYKAADGDDIVFIELKKKYDGIVYKRRMDLPCSTAMAWLCERKDPGVDSQIKREIDYFLDFYPGIRPAMFMSYEREAYYGNDDREFRLTLDQNILHRTEDFDFTKDPYGTDVLPAGYTLMEVKTPLAIPLWLTEVMSASGIVRASFSKYGNCYRQDNFHYSAVRANPYRKEGCVPSDDEKVKTMPEKCNRQVMEALGMSRVVIENGKVVEVSEPRLKYCPLFKKFRNIDEITADVVRENIEFRIGKFGLGTEDREVRADDYVTFGVSEILSTAMEQGVLEASVIVADGCGTAVVKEPAVVQGLCGRISGMVECSPIQKVLDAVGRENVLDPETTPIDQVRGAEKALAMGLKRFAVTVKCPEQARIIREMCGDRVVLVAVHTSCVSEEGARKLYEYCDFITACASKPIRDIAYAREDVVIAGNKVQIIAVTEIGKKLVVDKLHSIGREPWDRKMPTEDPRPLL